MSRPERLLIALAVIREIATDRTGEPAADLLLARIEDRAEIAILGDREQYADGA